MAQRGRPRAVPKFNSPEERELLFDWSRNPPQATQALALRCRIVQACADGYSDDYVAQHFKVGETMVAKWRRRYVALGPQGLFDKARSGVPASMTDEQVEEVLAKSLEERPSDAARWTTRSMARVADTTQSMIVRLWQKYGVDPRRVNIFLLCADPQFVATVRTVAGLYLNPPEGALVLGVDKGSGTEKTSAHISGSTVAVLPRRSQWVERPRSEPSAAGDLHRALEVAQGRVIADPAMAKVNERDRDFRLRRFLQAIERSVPRDLEVHVVVDHSSTELTDALQDWERGRFHLHTAPTYDWWLYLVDWWFAELARRGSGPSTTELAASINEWIENWIKDSRPFVWELNAVKIEVRRG